MIEDLAGRYSSVYRTDLPQLTIPHQDRADEEINTANCSNSTASFTHSRDKTHMHTHNNFDPNYEYPPTRC